MPPRDTQLDPGFYRPEFEQTPPRKLLEPAIERLLWYATEHGKLVATIELVHKDIYEKNNELHELREKLEEVQKYKGYWQTAEREKEELEAKITELEKAAKSKAKKNAR